MSFTVLPPQDLFITNSINDNSQSLANYLPNDDFERAKNIKGSNYQRLLHSFANELSRAENKIQELADEYYIPLTYNLIEQWEKALSIPDDCFSVKNKTIEERRKQVIAKFALMNLTTTQDFIDFAAFFGHNIKILNGIDHANYFPLTFPVYFFNSVKEAKFTMIIYFLDIDKPSSVFPLTFPITFGVNPAQFLICVFEKLKPAPVKILIRYRDS